MIIPMGTTRVKCLKVIENYTQNRAIYQDYAPTPITHYLNNHSIPIKYHTLYTIIINVFIILVITNLSRINFLNILFTKFLSIRIIIKYHNIISKLPPL